MQNSKSSKQSSSSTSTNHSNRLLSSHILSEYQYVGRLVTRERPIVRKTNLISRSNTNKYDYSTSSEDDDLSKPLGVIRISDRHVREIYRIPTPPPEIKRVVHRLRSPKPKIIERIFVCRPPLEIIENIIQVPPEKVRIINREKHLRPSKPIIRTKVVHLKSSEYKNDNQQPTTTFDYQPQPNSYPVNYIQSINLQPTCYTYSSPSNYFPNYSQY